MERAAGRGPHEVEARQLTRPKLIGVGRDRTPVAGGGIWAIARPRGHVCQSAGVIRARAKHGQHARDVQPHGSRDAKASMSGQRLQR